MQKWERGQPGGIKIDNRELWSKIEKKIDSWLAEACAERRLKMDHVSKKMHGTEGRTDYPQFSPVLDDPALACEGAVMCNHYRREQSARLALCL